MQAGLQQEIKKQTGRRSFSYSRQLMFWSTAYTVGRLNLDRLKPISAGVQELIYAIVTGNDSGEMHCEQPVKTSLHTV
jgi:hypothetical protein